MPAPTLNSFKAVQDFLNEVITQNGTGISSAKHGAFWTKWTNMTNTTYTEFTTGNVPNVSPPVRILIPKNSAQSNIWIAVAAMGPPSARPGDRVERSISRDRRLGTLYCGLQ
jgi:hypothetical protein